VLDSLAMLERRFSGPRSSREPAARDERFARSADRALLVGVGVLLLVGLVLLLGYGYGRDQGIYAVVAGAIVRGGAPYLDAWDFKPPAIFGVYAAARALLGPGIVAVRGVEALAYLSLVPAFMLLSRRVLGDARPGLLAAAVALFAQLQLEYWDTAQPESFGGVAVVWALVLALSAEDAGGAARRRAQLGAGALYAVAGLFKPHLGAGILVSAALAARGARRSGAPAAPPLLFYAVGGALVVAVAVVWLVAAGAWPATLETFLVFLPSYHAVRFEWAALPVDALRTLRDALFGFTAFVPAGLVLLVALPPLAPRERAAALHAVGVVLVQLAGVATQARFYPYHFAASLTLLALPAGWGLWKGWQRARRSRLGVAVALAAALMLAWKTPAVPAYGGLDFWERARLRVALLVDRVDPRAENLLHTAGDVHYGANRRAASWITTRTPPDSTLYVWGFEPMLYAMADRRPASRWIYNVPQRLDWEHRERVRKELLADLRRERPAAIVVVQRDVREGVTGSDRDSRAALERFPELDRLLVEAYAPAWSVEDLTVHLRRPSE